jgi:S-adenosylmethionine:tRNA ribosyltransferase-isomerase
MMIAIAEQKLQDAWVVADGVPALQAEALQAEASQSKAPQTLELGFEVPAHLEAAEPPEMRGLARDEVRLLVSYRSEGRLMHARFHDLPAFLDPGDVVVINTSGTLPAALAASRGDGQPLELHLSTHLAADRWTVELRRLEGKKSLPFYEAAAGEVIQLPGGATAKLLAPHVSTHAVATAPNRLWVASLHTPLPLAEYLATFGFPIRYSHVKRKWPLGQYQSVYVTEAGSAEMPSAGRPFTPELITRLVAGGVQVVPLLLHTGVASLEENELPYEEYYRLPQATASAVNTAIVAGRRVVAVGTTVVRALETAGDKNGIVRPGRGWTDLVITPDRGVQIVTAMLTGFHEPRASHLLMLEALAGREHLSLAYGEALRQGYLWHEFGDSHLIL